MNERQAALDGIGSRQEAVLPAPTFNQLMVALRGCERILPVLRERPIYGCRGCAEVGGPLRWEYGIPLPSCLNPNSWSLPRQLDWQPVGLTLQRF